MAISRSKYSGLTDEALLLDYRKNADNKIIGEFYLRYGHLVFGSCLKYLKDKENAEDCVMEIFAELGEKLLKHEVTYFKSWLYILTRNHCLLKLRKKNPNLVPINEELIEDNIDLENKKLLEIKLNELEQAIDELKPPQDEVIRLFYIEELTYKVISEKLNMSLNKVKSAIQNGKRNLKIKLMENGLFKSA